MCSVHDSRLNSKYETIFLEMFPWLQFCILQAHRQHVPITTYIVDKHAYYQRTSTLREKWEIIFFFFSADNSRSDFTLLKFIQIGCIAS